MGLINAAVGALLYFLVVGLDLALLFTATRGLARRWPVGPLRGLDGVGKPLLDYLLTEADRLGRRLGIALPDERARLIAVFITVFTARLLTASLFGLLP